MNETGEVFSDKLKAYTLELPEYRKLKPEDCKTKIDYWLFNLTNLETMTSSIPFQAQQPIFTKVGNIAELVHMTPEKRRKYNISIDSYRTNLSVMKNERAEGIAQGRAEGMAQGRAEGRAEGMAQGRAEEKQKAYEEKLSSARALKALGMLTNKQIAEALALTEGDVEIA